jgi:RNA polymerase sigma-70 factor (ECF subfamily)
MAVSKADFFRAPARLEKDAFEALFLEHYEAVYGVLFRLTGDRYQADDLAAETFWRLWERPPARQENVPGWLYRVATNLGYNRLRAERRRKRYETDEASAQGWTNSTAPDPVQATELKMERERVRAVLAGLPLRDVQALTLRHSGFSYKEIAAALDVPVHSVGTLLTRAEAKFEALYQEKSYASKK